MPLQLYLAPLMLYVLFVILFSLKILFEQKSLKTIFVIPFLFPLVHIPYGIGVIYGIYSSLRKKKEKEIKIKIRRFNLEK